MCKYFKNIGNTDHISPWKSKGLSHEVFEPFITFDNGLAPALSYSGNKTRVSFDERCLKQDNITFAYGKNVGLYNVYEINFWGLGYDDYPTLEVLCLLLLNL